MIFKTGIQLWSVTYKMCVDLGEKYGIFLIASRKPPQSPLFHIIYGGECFTKM